MVGANRFELVIIMDQIEFIEKQIKSALDKEGFSDYVSCNCSRQAVEEFKRKSHFAKGKVFDSLLK